MFSSLAHYKNWLDIRANPDKLVIGEMFASGGFKEVFHGTYDGQPVAVSVLNGTASSIMKSKRKQKLLARELRAMNMLSNHPGVPRFYGYWSMKVAQDQEQLVLVNEMCELGDLTTFVEEDRFEDMSMQDRMMLCVDLLRVLTVMHDEEIFHRTSLIVT